MNSVHLSIVVVTIEHSKIYKRITKDKKDPKGPYAN